MKINKIIFFNFKLIVSEAISVTGIYPSFPQKIKYFIEQNAGESRSAIHKPKMILFYFLDFSRCLPGISF